MSNRHEKEKGVNVQVLLRCRPFSDEEIRSNAPQVVTCNEFQREVSVSQNVAGKHFDRIFTFDKVFGPSAHQKDLYDLSMSPIVHEVLEGFNCTIFAYGQTGTGKTFTMEGECKRSKMGPNGELPAEAGIIPRAVKQIFDTLESQNAEYSVKVTFLELYNEEITDLLAPEEITKVCADDKQKKQLPLMEDGKGGVLVRGLEEEIVTSASEIFTLLERGSAKRRTAETLLNKQSSRSHSLFSITIHIKEPTPEGEELIKCGKLNLVDLAGSENISRSGAREGRAREAGEINKSLLTLGRVINALVEHVGHIPYRDSKLTRLLRDSLGGRTKTCIIATVSPAVHCLEETLSTLDYAHRAKNIKNKPEVNQKMMKSTLIKDLYGEIERLKADVYAAREKNGVYIPRDRYTLEEGERKAMAEQILQLGTSIENYQKQVEELQEKHDDQVKYSENLSSRLDATSSALYATKKSLSEAEEELKKHRYALKEKDFVISEHNKSENALAQQACALRLDLEKAVNDNKTLHNKISGENKVSQENKAIVNNFKNELSNQINSLREIVASSVSLQNDNLYSVKELCSAFLTLHSQSLKDMRDKLEASKSLYMSHSEAIQELVRLHKANSISNFEEILPMQSANFQSIQEIILSENSHACSAFNDLESTLANHQSEMTVFARELRQNFENSGSQTKMMSDYMHEFLQKVSSFSSLFDSCVSESEEARLKTISDFHKAYEEQSKCEAEKLAAEINCLIASHVTKQKELVDLNLIELRILSENSKSILNEHSDSMEITTADAKRKWQQFSSQADTHVKQSFDYAAAKHCRMETLFRQCADQAASAALHWNNAVQSVGQIGISQQSSLQSFVTTASQTSDDHVSRVTSACRLAEEELRGHTINLMQQIECDANHGERLVSNVLGSTEQHGVVIEKFRQSHSVELSVINDNARDTFESRYMDLEPSGLTPVRWTKEVLTVSAIESLKAMPVENLEREFRENYSFESFQEKEVKSSLIPRSPLSLLN